MKNTIAHCALATLVGGFLVGCSTPSNRLKPAAAAAPMTTYRQGQAILCQTKANGVLLAVSKPEFKPGDPPALFLLVLNNGAAPFLLAPSAVSVSAEGRPVRVYTYEELRGTIDKSASRKNFWTRVAAVGAAMSDSPPTRSETTGKFNVQGPYGREAYGNFSSTTYTYDPAARAAARAANNRQTREALADIEFSKAVQVDNLGWILRENTLDPGTYAGGVVKLHPEDLKDARVVLVTVQAGDETHEFPLEVVE